MTEPDPPNQPEGDSPRAEPPPVPLAPPATVLPATPPGPRSRGEADADPLSARELARVLWRPDLLVEYTLGRHRSLLENLARREALVAVVAMLLLTGLAATVPYGLCSPARNPWKIAVLFTGSLLLCVPSLHVFAQYLGIRRSVLQNLALGLLITSTAGLVLFGFFPIIWFIDLTTDAAEAKIVSVQSISLGLLAVAWLMGVIHMGRCLVLPRSLHRPRDGMALLVLVWLGLLIFVTYRMARFLELL